ncbi:hypothetical protein PTKIN_Ptkin09bG0268500 [Pterospermum kingtungense]
MLEEVCLGYDLPVALTWANVNEIMYKKHTLFLQTTFCYPSDLWVDERKQFIAGKALQSSEHFHFEENFPLLGKKYDAVAICLENNYKIDDVYVVEFLLPKMEKELQEPKSLALRIFNDLKNMKKKFVTVRSQLKGLNEQEEVIPNFHTPKHPLQLLLNDEQMSSNQSRVGDCSGCGEKVSAPSFSCVECWFYIHQKCAEAPLEIYHPYHAGDHPLVLQKFPSYRERRICDFCDKRCVRFFYHCSCDLDFHIKCALFTYDIAEKKLKELEHVALKDPLISPENNGEQIQKLGTCYACWEPIEKYAYFSPDCGFNLHKKCADLPLKINDVGHEHPLALQFNSERPICEICQRQIRAAGFKYCCSPCNYFIHIDCVLLPPNFEVKNHQLQVLLLNEQEVIPIFDPPRPMSPPVLHEQGSGGKTSVEKVKKDVNNLLKKQSKERRKSSLVWDEFSKKQDGVGNIRAICAHCKKDFDGSSKKGTTHLRNHLERCKLKAAKIKDQQQTFPVGSGDSKNESAHEGNSSFDLAKRDDSTTRDSNERNSMFDQERSCVDFARMIIKHQYPLDMAEQEFFKTFVKNLQPEFKFHESQAIILSDIHRIYVEEKEKLHRYFNQLACNFSLTVSLKNAYCCLIAHFIDDDWELNKRILAYKSVEQMYDTGILTGIIWSSISEWNMGSKICSITVDNSSLNDDIVQQIKENCLTNQGSLLSCHCFIGCTVISDGFREIYDKLNGALKSREIFCQLEKIDDSFRLNPSMEEWKKVVALHSCLKGFHDTISSLEGSQSLTSNLYFYKLCNIYKKFLQLEKSNYPFFRLMKGKFDCYWSLCNLVFAVAAVLDPRLKFEFVEFSYNEIYGRESQMQLTRFHKVLMDIYYEYANKFPRNLTTSASAFGEFNSSTRQSTQVADDCILDCFSKFESANNFKKVASWKSELDRYLDEMRLPLDGEFFDILRWWRLNSERFPTLGRMARDLLAIPVSVVPPCSNFSATIINSASSKLNAEDMEALMCSQNWMEMQKGKTEKSVVATAALGDDDGHLAEQPAFPDNEAPRNEDLAREATIWAEKDVRAYLVSLFTVKDFEHLRKWQDLAISGENVGPDKIQGKALAPLLKIPPHHVDWEDARSYYIGDIVVNQFFVLLERRYKRFPHEYFKHYSFDSSTATFLINGSKSESEVLSWVKQEDLKGVRKVFLPMCLHEHWLLFYADIDDKKLLWLDSNGHSRMSNLSEKHVIRRWFSEFLLPSLGHDQKDWSFHVPNDIPLQKNSVDCALFVMKYADCLTHGNCFPFSQEDVPHFRYRTFLDLCLGSICSETSQDGRVNHAQQENTGKSKRKIGENESTIQVKIPKNWNSEEDTKSTIGNAKDSYINGDNPSLDGWLKSAESAGESASSSTSVTHLS